MDGKACTTSDRHGDLRLGHMGSAVQHTHVQQLRMPRISETSSTVDDPGKQSWLGSSHTSPQGDGVRSRLVPQTWPGEPFCLPWLYRIIDGISRGKSMATLLKHSVAWLAFKVSLTSLQCPKTWRADLKHQRRRNIMVRCSRKGH